MESFDLTFEHHGENRKRKLRLFISDKEPDCVSVQVDGRDHMFIPFGVLSGGAQILGSVFRGES